MKNYAEELAYWFFRLNGFFLVSKYIARPVDSHNKSLSDSDLLGIKMPFSNEIIGLNTNEDISHLLYSYLFDGTRPNMIVGLICEVKAGEDHFILENENLLSQIKRLGFFDTDEKINDAFLVLSENSIYEKDNFSILKVIVCSRDNVFVSTAHWIKIDLEDIINYITKERFERYLSKFGGWDKFDSSLIQFLLWYKDFVLIRKLFNN